MSLILSLLVCGFFVSAQTPTPAIETYRLHYVERGHGAPLILLHGLGGDWRRWKQSIEPLSRRYRVIAIDQLGFGASDKPKIEYGDRVFARSLAAFMKSHHIERATVVGNSMGAGVAYAFAIDYPNLLDKLVIVGGGPTRCSELAKPDDPFFKRQALMKDRKSIVGSFEKMFYNPKKLSEQDRTEFYESRIKSQYASASEVHSFTSGFGCVRNDEIAKIKAPTLIVWGANDDPKSMAKVTRLKSELANVQIRWINQAAHLPHMEQPEAFVNAVTAFLGPGDSGY